MIKLRDWQNEALQKFQLTTSKFFLLDATPGAGKTFFAAFVASHLYERAKIDFSLIVVPSTAIKGDKDAGFLGDWNKAGIQLTPVLKDGRDPPKEYRGAIVTYQQLPNLVATIGVWAKKGVRLLLILDEIHHPSEDNTWGAAVEHCGLHSAHILGMTGTAFRGDERRISFVQYDAEGKAVADARYSYRKAVTDNVCRKVDFLSDDSMTQFMLDQDNHGVRVSEATKPDDLRGASSTVFRTDHEFLPRVIEKAEDCLNQYRSWDRDAGGIVVCRSGKDDDDNRHLLHVAALMQKTLGEKPEIISYDDPDANAKIERFRRGDQRWICAVRKISEGVDIKRLRVQIMAMRPTTELLFRQLVGRVVRVDDEKRPGDATVFIAKFPQLVQWASTISDEAEAGVKERDENNNKGRQAKTVRSFASLSATHEDSGAISDYGDEYTADEINAAKSLRGNDPELAGIPITTIAYLQRKLGIEPEPMAAAEPPLQIRKKRLRLVVVQKARRLAIMRNPSTPDFKRVWHEIGGTFGPGTADDLTDNYSIDVMRQVEAWLLATIGRESHA